MLRRSLRTVLLLACCSILVAAQDDEVPLGDVARALRQAKVASGASPSQEKPVIDNDNLPVMMEKAESERLNSKPVFSIDSSGKTFRMTSPDGTCSISFDAKATALIAAPFVASDLPQDELVRLDGPATIRDGVFEVSLHNATAWELKEIVVGITTPQNQSRPRVESAALESAELESGTKFPDVTTLYHLKASAPPDSVTLFQGNLADWAQGSEWHWALVAARGIPPAAPGLLQPTEPTLVPTAMPASQPATSAAPAEPSASADAPASNRAQPR